MAFQTPQNPATTDYLVDRDRPPGYDETTDILDLGQDGLSTQFEVGSQLPPTPLHTMNRAYCETR